MSFLGGEEQNTRDLEKGEVREEEKLGEMCSEVLAKKKSERGLSAKTLVEWGESTRTM